MSDELIWVFGYGSLMWRPELELDAFERATLQGRHRALCIYSHVHRGCPKQPGLVFGLAPGGACVGRALGFRVDREAEVLTAYDAREMVTGVYHRLRLPLRFDDGREREAWCYVANTAHPQYARDLSRARALELIRTGRGKGGACVDYVRSTLDHLREMTIDDPELEEIVAEL